MTELNAMINSLINTSNKTNCYKCNSTGKLVSGISCDVCSGQVNDNNVYTDIYYCSEFSTATPTMKKNYEDIIECYERLNGKYYNENLLICSPINTSKTILLNTIRELVKMANKTTTKVIPIIDIYNEFYRNSYATTYRDEIRVNDYILLWIPSKINPSYLDTLMTVIKLATFDNNKVICVYDGTYKQFESQNVFKLNIVKEKDEEFNKFILVADDIERKDKKSHRK